MAELGGALAALGATGSASVFDERSHGQLFDDEHASACGWSPGLVSDKKRSAARPWQQPALAEPVAPVDLTKKEAVVRTVSVQRSGRIPLRCNPC